MKTKQENKLMSLAQDLPEEQETQHQVTPYDEEPSIEDTQDISKNIRHTITETDYLILTDYSAGKTLDNISGKYTVSKAYINRLLRSEKGREFIDTMNSHKSKIAMDRATSMVSIGVEKQLEMIQGMFESGEDSRALLNLFGGMSMLEVLEKMKKMQSGETDNNDSNALLNFFGDITVNKGS